MQAVLEEFEPIFGEPKVEWTGSYSGLGQSSAFVFYVHSPDSSHLRICVSDFRHTTWEAVRSVSQLEDMVFFVFLICFAGFFFIDRDSVGIGGSWSEFIHYLVASIKSEDVKLLLEALPDSNGNKSAKLVAQKSKGMPRISFSLTKLTGGAASDAVANLSQELFKAFKGLQYLFMEEQERCLQLTKVISVEKENNEIVQSQLELNSKRQKLQKAINSLDKVDLTNGQNPPGKQAAQSPGPTKVTKRPVPAHRRAKSRGIILQDSENEKDS
ncbi:U2 small nuclear ribonucleoprotein auxiliary factor-like protein [Gossypium australe]|uniref:U2 small nuclear ribonucleoprotein auxiliary factor-like protein n=1 Tax=Gossypium australe TaxID=47621 RepID=A0A5B6WEC1_9ROSI|nr:U2 small nuclear ribonucleoprotein auxiliary factor-like protein [Gossypium australe]